MHHLAPLKKLDFAIQRICIEFLKAEKIEINGSAVRQMQGNSRPATQHECIRNVRAFIPQFPLRLRKHRQFGLKC